MIDSLKTRIYDTAAAGLGGSLSARFKACLCDGSTPIPVTSVVIANNVAVVTTAVNHDYLDGSVVELSGAAPAILNSSFRVSVVSDTQFTFPISEADTTATGTITARLPPAGWETAFSASDKVVVRASGAASPQWMFRIADSGASIKMYRGMTDIDTGTELVAQQFFYSASVIIADNRSVINLHTLGTGGAPESGYVPNFFGDLLAHSDTDLHCVMLSAVHPTVGFSGNSQGFLLYNTASVGQSLLARNPAGDVNTPHSSAFCFFRNAGHSSGKLVGAGTAYGRYSNIRPAGPVYVADLVESKIRAEVPGVQALDGYISAGAQGDPIKVYTDQTGLRWLYVRLRTSNVNTGGSADNHNGNILVRLHDWY